MKYCSVSLIVATSPPLSAFIFSHLFFFFLLKKVNSSIEIISLQAVKLMKSYLAVGLIYLSLGSKTFQPSNFLIAKP